jgi:hypothetical protein
VSERGQASVEIVACTALLAAVAVAALQWLALVRAHIAAERIADQAAVLAAEGRPIPSSLAAEGRIERRGNRITVRVPVAVRLPGVASDQSAVAVLPRV